MRLYLCGPMTGIKQYNFPKFMEEAKRLRSAGYDVVNPADHAILYGFDPIADPDIVCTSERRRKFLENDKKLLDTCDGMALMEGWETSDGCKEEIWYFETLGRSLDIYTVESWITESNRPNPPSIMTPLVVELDGRPATQEEILAAIDGKPLPVTPPIRTFATGATRDTDTNKLDFDGFLCPLVIERYAEYMNANRKMADGSIRGSDNWKAGIPQEVYRKSTWRHFFAFWKHCLSGNKALAIVDACGILFNVMGWMHEELKHDNNRTA
jgi:hypothetical protein